jgi:hypothetical protein
MKRMGLILLAVVLSATALAGGPAKAAPRSSCNPPACFASPGCCLDSQCASWCESRGFANPVCQGGCCACDSISIDG